MKKIIFILIIAIASLDAKPCMTDIYYGNGVWNTRSQGEDGMWALRRFMQTRAITPLSIENEKNKLYSFKHAYNPSRGTIDDLIETFWQLKESGQITDGYFFAIYSALAAESNGDEFLQKLQTIISNYNSDVNAMYQLYTNASFNQKHNVLLITHSQGNLFGNKMYTLMSDAQKNKFRMVSVATPADGVAGGGPYVTASGDYVINPIPGALPSNVDGFGHTFIGTYLNGSINAPRQIALYVKNAYNNLQQTTSCTLYDGTYVRVYGFSHMEVYAYTTGIPRITDLIATVPISTFDPQYDENNMPYCPSPMTHYPGSTYFGACDASSCSWLPGNLDSTALEHRKGLTHHALKDNQCATFSLSGELYDTIYHALNE